MPAICDPSELWIKHQIRWLENGKKGPGWYKLKQTGKANFFVKLVSKECPICGDLFNTAYTTMHPRPDAWLEAADKKTRDDNFRAVEAERALLALDNQNVVCEVCDQPGHNEERCPNR